MSLNSCLPTGFGAENITTVFLLVSSKWQQEIAWRDQCYLCRRHNVSSWNQPRHFTNQAVRDKVPTDFTQLTCPRNNKKGRLLGDTSIPVPKTFFPFPRGKKENIVFSKLSIGEAGQGWFPGMSTRMCWARGIEKNTFRIDWVGVQRSNTTHARLKYNGRSSQIGAFTSHTRAWVKLHPNRTVFRASLKASYATTVKSPMRD